LAASVENGGRVGSISNQDVLEIAVELEGHPDNAAAALCGGVVNVYRERGRWCAAAAAPSPDLRPVLLVPKARVSTATARRALPLSVPFADAAFNAGRAALAWRALTGHPELLTDALQDRLHQDARLSAVPAVRAVF